MTGDQLWNFCTGVKACYYPVLSQSWGKTFPPTLLPLYMSRLVSGMLERDGHWKGGWPPTRQVGWAQQRLWTPLDASDGWTSAGPDGRPAGPYKTRHILWLTFAFLPNGGVLTSGLGHHIPFSRPGLHHHLVFMRTGDGVRCLSLCIFILPIMTS